MEVEQILQKMAENGMRITEQRRTLARIFVERNSFLTPKEVYDEMGKHYSGLSFDTVYRNLRVLSDMGVLEQVVFEEAVKFRLHCQEHHHHHHLICLDCGRTIPIMYCPMDAVAELPEPFQIVRHKFEVFGYCQQCASQAQAE